MSVEPTEEEIKLAKFIVGKWGYEEQYWWEPIAQALADQRTQYEKKIADLEERKKAIAEILGEKEQKIKSLREAGKELADHTRISHDPMDKQCGVCKALSAWEKVSGEGTPTA